MKAVSVLGLFALWAGAGLAAMADGNSQALVVTASNATNNQLLVYDATGRLLQTVPTRGQGGAGGNAGGIEARGTLLAVVNFGSQSVSLFQRADNGFHLQEVIATASSPLSVAFGHDHLYILGTTTIESHPVFGPEISAHADGVVNLLKGDGSSAQVGVVETHLIITEKSNLIETVALSGAGAIAANPVPVQNIPANVNAPFGLVTRDDNAYVTIAHAGEISLVRDGAVLTTTPTSAFPGPQQHAPCWLTLVGPFLYSSNSPSSSISRYAVYGQKIVADQAIAATLNGAPTDIASGEGLVAVIDGNGPVSHLTLFRADEDGNLTVQGSATIASPANGVAIVGADSRENE